LTKDGAAEKAGLKVGDTVIAIDGDPVASPEDVRIALFYRKRGEIMRIKVRRGDEEIDLNLSL
jgi:S1-C subfamily serine protease